MRYSSPCGDLTLQGSAMPKLEVQYVEVFFGNVDYSCPVAKAILGQYLEICREANALKDLAQLRHSRCRRGRDRHCRKMTWVSSVVSAEGDSAYLRNANCFSGLACSGPGSLRAREAEGCMVCSRDSIQPVQPSSSVAFRGGAASIANQTTVALA